MSEQTQTAPAQETTNAAAPATTTQVTPEAAAAAAAPAQNQQAAPVAEQSPAEQQPTQVELKVPEETYLKQSEIDQIKTYAKEKNLTTEQAQELLMQRHEALNGYVEAKNAEIESIRAAWPDAAKKDPEIGGESFGQNVELAKRAVEKFATPELRQFLDESKMGNHPEVIRVFMRMGKLLAEDKMIMSGANSGGQKKSHEEIFYGKQN